MIDCAGPIPTDQTEIMKQLLVTMRDIQRFMNRSCTPESSSSKSSSRTGSSIRKRPTVSNPPVVSPTPQPDMPSVKSHYQSKSASCPPGVSRHPVAISAAIPQLSNLSILDAAVPSVGLPRPILSQDLLPSSVPAASPEGHLQNQSAQPLNPLVINPAQPLVSFCSQQRQSSLSRPQSSTSHYQQEQRHLAPSGRTHVYKCEAPSFPNLTREDEMQYRMLRMALTNLLDPNETEQISYSP